MQEQSTETGVSSRSLWDRSEDFAREHVRRFIQALPEEEVTALVGRPKSARRATVDAPAGYRHGHGKPRRPALTCGTITVRRPRVRGLAERFVGRVLPLFQRRTKPVGALLPRSYLHGSALGDFEPAVRGLPGEGAPLSSASLQRLKARWLPEYDAWKQRRRDALEIVSVWADGPYVKAGSEAGTAALRVLVGALTDGRKMVLAVERGRRESEESWGAVLRDLRARGLKPWRCTVADGHLGIRAALAEQQPTAAEQRCWNHRILNVPDAIPEKHHPDATTLLKAMPYAETRTACEHRRVRFGRRYRTLAPQAVARLSRDRERLVTFYRFPREHWQHLRTTNVVESPFAAVRLRTTAGKRYTRVESATASIWKVLQVAEQTFRRLNAPRLLPAVYAGTQYVDGVRKNRVARQEVAA